jgi:acyl-CoA dehydrogenase
MPARPTAITRHNMEFVMPPDSSPHIDAWLAGCEDPAHEPLQGMTEAGLLEPAASYTAIARMKAAMVERTGLPGIAGVWGGRQLVQRFFIAGFGDASQRAAWRGRALAVAISEPEVGAHPKHLTTHAAPDGDGFRITGEKAWVSNGPLADGFIVLAITSVEAERKRYSALLVPRGAPGVSLHEMPAFHALHPSRHCGLVLEDVLVPHSAVLGPVGTAYETMALPFRDLEDAVGTFTLLGAFRFLLSRLAVHDTAGDDAALSLGGVAALTALFAEGAEAVVAALDGGRLADKAATLVGLRLLAADLLQRARVHQAEFGPHNDEACEQLMADLDALLSVARGPRLARQARLGRAPG